MSFHESCISFELDDDHILKAVLRDGDGGEQDSELDLNDIIGNDNGTLSPAS
jgi:CVNH domain.